MAKTKKTKIKPGVTNKLHGGRRQVQRPKAALADSTRHIGFSAVSSDPASSYAHGEPYYRPGKTGKVPGLQRVPTFRAGMLKGLRKIRRKFR